MKEIFFLFFPFFFSWGFPEINNINCWIYWSNTSSFSLIFIYLSLVFFLSTSNDGTERWVDAMCCGLLFAKFEPESRKVKREQRWLQKSKIKAKLCSLPKQPHWRLRASVSWGCLWDYSALQSTSTNPLLQRWEAGDDGEEGLAGSCWRLESVVPAR